MWRYRDKNGNIFMRHPAPRHSEGQSDNHDALGVLPISIEVKRCEQLNLWAALDQAHKDAKNSRPDPRRPQYTHTPVVFHRKNNKSWIVILDADDFLDLIEELHR